MTNDDMGRTDRERSSAEHSGKPPSRGGLEDRLARLIESANALCGDGELRREPLVERAEALGLERTMAERAYDLGREEKLPPAYGIAVVAAGVSVQPLESAKPDVGETTSGEPAWVDTPPEAGTADLERRLRQTFRRVRAFVEDAPTPGAAFSAFAREPDLETFDY